MGFGAIGPLRTHAAALTPYEQSWTFGLERQLPWNVVFGATYVGKKGTHLYFAGDNNPDILGPAMETHPNLVNQYETYVTNPFSSQNGGPISDPNSTLASPTVQEYQLKTPFPEFSGVATDEPPIANSTYNGLQLTANKRYSNGLELVASFTWSKSIDDSSMYDTNVAWLANYGGEAGWALQDPNNPKSERSLSTFDVPYMVKFSYSYDLPIGRGKAFGDNMPRFLDAIIGGWKTNGIWNMHSGWPLQFFVLNGGTPLPTYGPQRPNFVGEPRRSHGSDTYWVNNYFANPASIQTPAPFTLGNAPRTTGAARSPFFFDSDLSIAKQFLLSNVHEGIRLEMRLEAENAFNHPLLGTPDTNAGDPSLGQITYVANPRPTPMSAGLESHVLKCTASRACRLKCFHLRTKSDAGGIERNRYRPSLSEVVLNGYHFCSSSRVTLTLCTKRATAASLQVPDHSPVSAAMKGCQIRQKCSCLKLKIRIRNRWPAEANDRNLVSVGSHVL